MTNHQNLTVAYPMSTTCSQHLAVELAGRFSFQSYSDDNEEIEDPVMLEGTTRRALLDKRLLEEVYEQVAMHGDLETGNLTLSARNGVVTIDGSVSDRAMRAQIGNFIRRCAFVKSVVNRIRTRDADNTTATWQAENLYGNAGRSSRAIAA